MAHIAKYKATSVGHMLAHYRREYRKATDTICFLVRKSRRVNGAISDYGGGVVPRSLSTQSSFGLRN